MFVRIKLLKVSYLHLITDTGVDLNKFFEKDGKNGWNISF